MEFTSIAAEFIGNVGFPIFIAIYFVYHQDKRLSEIDVKLDRMNTLIALVLAQSNPESLSVYEKVFEGGPTDALVEVVPDKVES